jgi:hypothetical protein
MIQQPEPSGSEAGETGQEIWPTKHLTHGTDGFTSPPKEVRATDFYHP